MNTVSDMLGSIEQYIRLGYNHDYRVKGHCVHDITNNKDIPTEDLVVDASLRFESAEGSQDGSNIYAISDRRTTNKGLLIDAFDTFDKECSKELFALLNKDRQTSVDQESVGPSRYGLRKIYKSEFDVDPERFVLRVGFPDFPTCPFGSSYSMLGFDTAEQTYVWLVTSILRDSRLARVPYQGVEPQDDG